MSRREWLVWTVAAVAVAALVHMGTIYELPRFITARTLARIGPPNTMHFGKRPNRRHAEWSDLALIFFIRLARSIWRKAR